MLVNYPGHRTSPGVWLIYSVKTHGRKLIFPLTAVINCKAPKSFLVRGGTRVNFPLSAGTHLALNCKAQFFTLSMCLSLDFNYHAFVIVSTPETPRVNLNSEMGS